MPDVGLYGTEKEWAVVCMSRLGESATMQGAFELVSCGGFCSW